MPQQTPHILQCTGWNHKVYHTCHEHNLLPYEKSLSIVIIHLHYPHIKNDYQGF